MVGLIIMELTVGTVAQESIVVVMVCKAPKIMERLQLIWKFHPHGRWSATDQSKPNKQAPTFKFPSSRRYQRRNYIYAKADTQLWNCLRGPRARGVPSPSPSQQGLPITPCHTARVGVNIHEPKLTKGCSCYLS